LLSTLGRDQQSWGPNSSRMSCTALLLHGHLCLTVLTHHSITCNSSRIAEIVSHGLIMLFKRVDKPVDLRRCLFHGQSDNAAKKCKNQCLVRHPAVQVGLMKLKGALWGATNMDSTIPWIVDTPGLSAMLAIDNPGHRPFEKYQNDSEKIPQCMRTKRNKRTETVLTEFKDWDRLHLGHADPPCFNKRFLNLFHPILNSQSFWEIFLLMSALALSN